MNFVSNKDFYQRISHIGVLRTKASSIRVSVQAKENAASNEKLKRAPVPTASTSRNINDFENPSSSTVLKNQSTVWDTTSSDVYLITAITEGRGYAEGEIGLATIDINSPTLLLSQFSDGIWYYGIITKLQILNPKEIIIPRTIFESESKLLSLIKEKLPKSKIVPIPRRHYNVSEGLQMLKTYCASTYLNQINFIQKKYYALAAAAALLKSVDQLFDVNFLKNSLRLEYQTQQGRMLIDYDSCLRLELLYPLCSTKEKKASLFGMLDYTVTAVGRRFLRAHILEPYSNTSDIRNVHEAVNEIIDDPDLLFHLQDKLKQFNNVDQILKLCIIVTKTDENLTKAVEAMLNRILLLKTTLEFIPDLAYLIRHSKTEIMKNIYQVFTDSRFSVMLMEINDVIRPEVQFSRGSTLYFQRIHAVREGVEDFLDLMRKMYTKLADNIREEIGNLAVKHDLPLRMIYSQAKGFHIQITLKKNSPQIDISPEITTLYKKGNNIYLTHPVLAKLNTRIEDVIKEIHIINDKVIRKLIEKLIQYTEVNYSLVGAVAQLDIVQSFAKISSMEGFCCPTFGDETRVINAIHPLLEHSRVKPTPVPNNMFATPEYNIFIITGPNMGGKTIYIKTIGILQIMAQLGCYVPAKEASFRICDKIFTRIGFEDNTEQNASNFKIEMQEMEYIFKMVTPNSLIIIDELCRSTNTKEGSELAWKLCERLCLSNGMKKNGEVSTEESNEVSDNLIISKKTQKLCNITAPFVFITTHFLQLTMLAEQYHNITNLYLSAEEKYVNDMLCLKYNHKVTVGVNPLKGYGLCLARCIKFPERVLPRAIEILTNSSLGENSLRSSGSRNINYIDPDFHQLEKTLNETEENFYKERNSSKTHVANFMNVSVNFQLVENSIVRSITVQELLKDFESQLYDLYGQIASHFRTHNNSSEKDLEILSGFLQEFVQSQPKELLDSIFKKSAAGSKANISFPDPNRLCAQKTKQLSYSTIIRDKPGGSRAADFNNLSMPQLVSQSRFSLNKELSFSLSTGNNQVEISRDEEKDQNDQTFSIKNVNANRAYVTKEVRNLVSHSVVAPASSKRNAERITLSQPNIGKENFQ